MKKTMSACSLLVLVGLCIGYSNPSMAFDTNDCPSHLNFVYSNIARISEAQLLAETKSLYNYSTDFDAGAPIRDNWRHLNGVNQYSVQATLYSKSDNAPSPYCTYLTGTTGVWTKLIGMYRGHGQFDAYLQVSTPFGLTTAKVLAMGLNGIQLSQDPSSRSIVNSVHAGYEDGGYNATVVIAMAGGIFVH